MGDTISRVHDDIGSTARSTQGQDNLESLEHELGHLLPVGLVVEENLSEQDGLLLRGNIQLTIN